MANRYDDEIKIDDALRVLEAAARERKDDLKRTVQDKYASLKDLFSSEFVARLGEPINRVKDVLSKSGSVARKTVRTARYEVDEHPWMAIAKVAGIFLIIGYTLGRRAFDDDSETDYDS